MMPEYVYKPAFYAHILSSICIVIAVYLLITNYKKVLRLDSIEIVKIFSVLAIAIASHGQGHIDLEQHYGYDPIGILRY